jgi:hypothetical protein
MRSDTVSAYRVELSTVYVPHNISIFGSVSGHQMFLNLRDCGVSTCPATLRLKCSDASQGKYVVSDQNRTRDMHYCGCSGTVCTGTQL